MYALIYGVIVDSVFETAKKMLHLLGPGVGPWAIVRASPLLSFRESGTYAAPGKGRARSSTEPRAPNDPGGE